jgi:hypothetical protein
LKRVIAQGDRSHGRTLEIWTYFSHQCFSSKVMDVLTYWLYLCLKRYSFLSPPLISKLLWIHEPDTVYTPAIKNWAGRHTHPSRAMYSYFKQTYLFILDRDRCTIYDIRKKREQWNHLGGDLGLNLGKGATLKRTSRGDVSYWLNLET